MKIFRFFTPQLWAYCALSLASAIVITVVVTSHLPANWPGLIGLVGWITFTGVTGLIQLVCRRWVNAQVIIAANTMLEHDYAHYA